MIRLLAFILLIVIFQAGCENKRVTHPLRIGTIEWPGYQSLYLAEMKNYYNGSVKMVEMGSASEVLRAYKNDAIELAALTLDEVLLLRSQGFDPIVLAILDISNGGDVIMGNKGINTMQDLKGKSLGFEYTALGAYVVARALTINNLNPSDLKLVPLELSEHEYAFEKYNVDAVVTFEPVKSYLLEKGAKELFSSKEIPGEIVDVLVASKSVIENRTEDIVQIISGWRKGQEYLINNPSEAATLISAKYKLSAEEFLNSLEGLKLPDLKENIDIFNSSFKDVVDNLQDIMIKNNLISKDIKTDDLVNKTFLENISN